MRTRVDGFSRMPRAERIVRHQASPLQHLPADKARHAEHEIGGPLDQRQRDRLLRRNAERGAQQHQTAFLRAERAGNGERRPANGMQETFYDQRFGDADRIAHEREHDQDLGNADDPAGHMDDGAGHQVGPGRVDRGQVLIDGIDRAEHAPLSITGKSPDGRMEKALPATTLHQIEAGEQEARRGSVRSRRPTPATRPPPSAISTSRPSNREQKLRCRLQEDVDDHARCRERAGNRVDASAKPAPMTSPPTCAMGSRTLVASRTNRREHAGSKPRPRLRRKNQPPARPGDRNGDAAHHHDEENSPPDAGHGVADRIQAGPRRNGDDGGDPDQPGSHTGLLDHLRSDPPKVLAAAGCRSPVRTSRRTARADPADRCRTQASYQGDLMSKEWVAPTPNVSWFGVPRCSTSGELAASPVSRSYSTKAWVANCGVQK